MERSQTARHVPDSEERRRPAAGTSGASTTATGYARETLHSGALAGLLGALTLVRARRTLLAGSSDDAVGQGMLAVF